jgi:hypothetical protein
MGQSSDVFLSRLREQTQQKYSIDNFLGLDEKSLTKLQSQIKLELRELLGVDRIQPGETKLSVKTVEAAVDMGDYTREKIVLTMCDVLDFPLYILKPHDVKPPYNLVLFCHGHGIGARASLGLDLNDKPAPPDYHKLAPVMLSRLGYIVAVPEIIGFGDTMLSVDLKNQEGCSCHIFATNLLMQGLTILGLRVYQAMSLLDYLLSTYDVNPETLCCMGISGGGMLASFFSALDERIKTAVVSGYISSFSDSIMAMRHCICNFVPGIYSLLEMDTLAGLIFPRRLVIEGGTRDPIFPSFAVRKSCEKLQKLYDTYDHTERFGVDIFEGAHEISGKVAYQMLSQIIKPL